MAVRIKTWVCGRILVETACSNPVGAIDICLLWCVLWGRGLCVRLISRPEESYRVWCV